MNNKGFSLVGVLISLIIGTLIITAGVGMLISNTRTLTFSEIRGELNDEARSIETLISRDIRMAGYQVTSQPFEASTVSLTTRYVRGGVLETVEYSFADNYLTRNGSPLGQNVTSFLVDVNSDTTAVRVVFFLRKADIQRRYEIVSYPRNLNLN